MARDAGGYPLRVSHLTIKSMMEVNCNESQTVSEAYLREMQDNKAQRPGYGHLPEPEAQAEAGLIL